MICLTCHTPLVAPAIRKTLSPDNTRFELIVPCTVCRAVWKVEQLELRPADPERIKQFPVNSPGSRVTYCSLCSGTITVGEENKHTCPALKQAKIISEAANGGS